MADQLMHIAEEAAVAAGKEIMRVFAAGKEEAFLKEDDSPVTKADRLSDIIIREHLAVTGLPVLSEEQDMVPFEERNGWSKFWMVDPLDGTKEFIRGLDEFSVNIALIHGQIPVGGLILLPWQELLYSGDPDTGVLKKAGGRSVKINPLPVRKQLANIMNQPGAVLVSSRSHRSESTRQFIERFNRPVIRVAGSSVKFIQLLEGQADIYPRFEPSMEWDTAAGHALLRLTNRGVYQTDMSAELLYNKPDLTNPSFIAL